MLTINFHKALRKFTNGVKTVQVDAVSYAEAVRACINLFPDFEKMVKIIGKKAYLEEMLIIEGEDYIVPIDNILLPANKNKILTFCPTFGGGNRVVVLVLVIVVVIILFWWNPYGWLYSATIVDTAAAGAATGTTIVSLTTFGAIALGLALNAFISLILPTFGTAGGTGGLRKENNFFGGLGNSTSPATPVFLNYGLIKTGGQIISGYIFTEDKEVETSSASVVWDLQSKFANRVKNL